MLETSANDAANLWRSLGGGYSSVIMQPKHLADSFLNHNFGWVPFIGDILKLYDVYKNTEKYIEQTVRHNHTWMKRARVIEESDTNTRLNRFYSSGTEPSNLDEDMKEICRDMVLDGNTCRGYCDIYSHSLTRVWAAGSFMYYRPEFDDNLLDYSSQWANVQRMLTIYGARINPTLLWKVTPWTWLIDWFTGIGKFIEFHDDFVTDGIVSRYLYCMRSEESTISKVCTLNFYSGPRTFTFQRRRSLKQREVADSPYGFNQPWGVLSLKQWAILGAIGITRTNSGFISHGA
jgi:hypothetical protein